MLNIIHHHSRLVYDSLQPPVDVQVGEWVLERNARHFRVIRVPPWAPQLRITGLWWFDSAAWHDGRVSGRPKSAKSPWWMHFEKLSNRSWSRKMADGGNCYQSKALISLCRSSRNWSWPLKHLEFSQRARFVVFFCEVDAFFWKKSLKRSVTLDIWHLTILLCQKSCILRRWRPLKRSAVKPAWMAPWWISSRLNVTWPHLHPSTRKVDSVLVRSWWRTSVHTFFRAWLTFLRTDFIIWIVLLICNAFLLKLWDVWWCYVPSWHGFWWLRVSSSFTVSLFRQNFYRAEKGLVLCKARKNGQQFCRVTRWIFTDFLAGHLGSSLELSSARSGLVCSCAIYIFHLFLITSLYPLPRNQ